MASRGKEVRKESAKRIRSAREARGWTQKELAKQTGFREDREIQPPGTLTPSRIGNYEQATRWLGWDEALTLSSVFPEHHPAYFLGVITEQEARVIQAMGSREPVRSTLPFKPVSPKEEQLKGRRS